MENPSLVDLASDLASLKIAWTGIRCSTVVGMDIHVGQSRADRIEQRHVRPHVCRGTDRGISISWWVFANDLQHPTAKRALDRSMSIAARGERQVPNGERSLTG